MLAIRQRDHGPVGRHAHTRCADPEPRLVDDSQIRRALAGPARVLGDRPLRCPLVEVLGVRDVVAAPHLGLDPEQVLRVTQVGDQRLRHLGRRREQAREGLSVRSHQRITLVHHVEDDLAREGIHRGLHRVTHVVEAMATKAAGTRQLARGCELGIRIPIGGGVAVHHVEDPTVDQDRVRVGVEEQERGQLLNPVPHVAHVEDPRVRRHEVGDQGLQLAEAQGERRPTDQRPHADAALAADIGVADLLGLLVLVGVVHLGAGGADHGIAVESLAHVQLRPIQGHVDRWVDQDREVANQEVGVSRALHPTHRRHGHAVTVGERHVLVLPRPVLVHFQLAGAQQHLGGLTVDGVAVGVHLVGEGVVLALALQPVEGALHDLRVQDPNVADRPPVRPKVGCVDLVVEVGKLHHGDPVEAERRPGGFDVPGYVQLLLLGLRRLHSQALDDRRVDAAHYQRHERPQPDGQRGQHPAPPPDVHQQQHDGEQGDEDQEVHHRELRIHVGVGGSDHGTPVRGGQLESCQPVVPCPHEGDEAE